MKNETLKVRGKELGFYFDTRAWLDLEDRFGSMGEMVRRMDDGNKPLDASIGLLRVTCNAYQRKNGLPEDVTEDWLADNLPPKLMQKAILMAKNAYIIGMKRETEDEEEADEDVVLAEIEKKTEAESGEES